MLCPKAKAFQSSEAGQSGSRTFSIWGRAFRNDQIVHIHLTRRPMRLQSKPIGQERLDHKADLVLADLQSFILRLSLNVKAICIGPTRLQ
jgi:hypothetical protein